MFECIQGILGPISYNSSYGLKGAPAMLRTQAPSLLSVSGGLPKPNTNATFALLASGFHLSLSNKLNNWRQVHGMNETGHDILSFI